jgi:hypothetical protein
VSPRAAVPWASLSWAATLMLLIGGMVAVGLGLFTFGLLRAARGGGSAAEIAPATGPQIELPEVVEVVEEDDLGLEELPPEQPALPEATVPVVTPTQTPSAAATQPVVEPMEPAPPPASPPSVNGSWSGTVDGRPANLTVQVDGARLSGELNLQTGPNSGATSITGTLLPNGDEWTVNITASELHYQLIGRMGGNSGSGELLIRGRNRGKWSLSR